ncbi:hypothetical protein [Mycobacterium decipiens]|uniref:Uncharacterized protein n=1 Tax=Mycobacterium decipiens TaxID=1430326 RepID=A0A1X2M0U5_9MYCO|nr:hypothetical protein [Mycobacterium decipiens]OSC43166.1 hypothetical protein B8W66_01935 [Mycobacterium decipiens]
MFRSKTARPNNFIWASVAGSLIALPFVAFAPIASASITPDPNPETEIFIPDNEWLDEFQQQVVLSEHERELQELLALEEPERPSTPDFDDLDLVLSDAAMDIPREEWIEGIEDIESPPPLGASPSPMDDQTMAEIMAAQSAPDLQVPDQYEVNQDLIDSYTEQRSNDSVAD